jgi:hypothetical protein
VPANASGAITSSTINPNKNSSTNEITEKTMIVTKFLLKMYQDVFKVSETEKG